METYRECSRVKTYRETCLVLGALDPSKSGLMNKHIVKHRSRLGPVVGPNVDVSVLVSCSRLISPD
jgi:hypothetical protein